MTMDIEKPSSRKEYGKHLTDLDGKCAFCGNNEKLTLKKFKHWTWVFSAFPYKKHHTLLIPKRHITRLSELNLEELNEFTAILAEIEMSYRHSKIIDKVSLNGDQMFFSWRSRHDDSIKKSVAHFHLHIYPKFATVDDLLLDPEASDYQMDILKASVV